MKAAKEILYPAAVLFLICLVAATLLALTNEVTAPVIEGLLAETSERARAAVLPGAHSFDGGGAVVHNGKEYPCYRGFDADGKLAGFTFTTSAKGYGGDISVMTGIDANGAVTGVSVLSMNETPGLGMKTKGENFLSQFSGKSGKIGVSRAGRPAENGIDAITGATISSRAVTDAVNLALELYSLEAGELDG